MQHWFTLDTQILPQAVTKIVSSFQVYLGMCPCPKLGEKSFRFSHFFFKLKNHLRELTVSHQFDISQSETSKSELKWKFHQIRKKKEIEDNQKEKLININKLNNIIYFIKIKMEKAVVDQLLFELNRDRMKVRIEFLNFLKNISILKFVREN